MCVIKKISTLYNFAHVESKIQSSCDISKMWQLRVTVLSLLLTLWPLSVCSESLYVSVNGTDADGCGTVSSPCATIAYVISLANDGDNISITEATTNSKNN